jgi:aspartate oxidase
MLLVNARVPAYMELTDLLLILLSKPLYLRIAATLTLASGCHLKSFFPSLELNKTEGKEVDEIQLKHIRQTLKKCMANSAGIVRSFASLHSGVEKINKLNSTIEQIAKNSKPNWLLYENPEHNNRWDAHSASFARTNSKQRDSL